MQHRSYQPLLPAGNKYLQQKWDKASYDLHRRKVQLAKPTISTTPPKTYGHLALKLKKQKLEEEWTMKIERENNMLMDKISHIMRTTGGVDNRNYYEKKSLGKEKRQLELLRITKENQMMLLRLSQCRPHYDVRSWHEDWLKTLKGQENCSKKKSSGDRKQKMSSDADTLKPASHEQNGKAKCEENEERKEASETEDTVLGIQQDPKPNISEKFTSPDTPEKCDPSDTVQITTD